MLGLLFSTSIMARDLYRYGMNPGMKLRVYSEHLDRIQSVLNEHLPDIIDHDIGFKKSERLQLVNIPFTEAYWFDIEWYDIVYEPIKLDVSSIKFEIQEIDGFKVIYFDFPAIKHWQIEAIQRLHTIFGPVDSTNYLFIEDFDFNFVAQLNISEKGFFEPIVYNVTFDRGGSYVLNADDFQQMIQNQFVELSIVMFENTAYFLG